MHNASGNLTSGRLLALNTLWNVVGTMLPLLFAIIVTPRLIAGLGVDRFGILTLAWVIIGYFSLFDLGIGRALTKIVADKLGTDRDEDVPALFWTGLLLMLALGVAGGLVMAAFSPYLVYSILKIPESLQTETLQSFYLLAAGIPVVIVSTGPRGYLAAKQRFGMINAIRVPLGIFNYVGPLFVLPFSDSIFSVCIVLVIGRIVACVVYMYVCLALSPGLVGNISVDRKIIIPLVSFGSWITVSNLVSPVMDYVDRFFVGAMISVTAVAYYATPYDAVSKLLIIPGALTTVLFPAFASSFARDREKTVLLFARGVKYIYMVLTPLIIFIVLFAHDILLLWLGPEFAANSTRVMQWLAVGVFMNCLAQMPFAMLQGVGRPDITAKLHLVELPFYLLGIWAMTGRYGINGMAIAWAARVTLDAAILFILAYVILPVRGLSIRSAAVPAGLALAILVTAVLSGGTYLRLAMFLLFMAPFSYAAWHLMLSIEERASIFNAFQRKVVK